MQEPATTRARIHGFFRDHWLVWELGMGALAIVFVGLPFLADGGTLGSSVDLGAIEAALTAFFFFEFAIRLWASPDRLAHLGHHWIAAVALIPVLRGIRIARLLRLGRLVRTFAGLQRASTTIDRLAPYQTIFNLVIAWFTIMVVSALTFYSAEKAVNPAVVEVADAFWWSINTITIGSTEITAVTEEGRIATAVLVVLGVGLFAAITASLIALVGGERENQHVRSRLRLLIELRDDGQLAPEAFDAEVDRLSLERPGSRFAADDDES